MRRLLLAVAIAIGLATPAAAQVAYPPVAASLPPAMQDEITAAKAMSMTANAKADAAATAAAQAAAAADAACKPVAAVPPNETVGGAAGSGSDCRLVNAIQPRITRAVIGTTGAGGTVAVTWAALPAVPIVIPIPMVAAGAAQAPLCNPVDGTISTTGATIRCFTTQSVTVSLLGAVVAPLTTAAAGVKVEVFAVPTTN